MLLTYRTKTKRGKSGSCTVARERETPSAGLRSCFRTSRGRSRTPATRKVEAERNTSRISSILSLIYVNLSSPVSGRGSQWRDKVGQNVRSKPCWPYVLASWVAILRHALERTTKSTLLYFLQILLQIRSDGSFCSWMNGRGGEASLPPRPTDALLTIPPRPRPPAWA